MKYTKFGNVKSPKGNRKEDSGFDCFVGEDWNNGQPYILRLNEQVNIPLDISTKFNSDKTLIMFNKSGVSTKKGTVQGACVIDPAYRGIIHCNLLKASRGSEDIKVNYRGFFGFILGLFGIKQYATVIKPGEKITQGIIFKVSDEELEEISNEEYAKGPKTKRGAKGFGEGTGTK